MTFLTDQATEYTLDRALTQRECQAMKRAFMAGADELSRNA